jgi:GMP synthase-like glutamine amidotransferase
MRICCVQHVPFETPGRIADWARSHGHSVSLVRLFAGEVPPPVEAFDWLVVMGGPMGAYDDARFPLLAAQTRAIAEAMEAGRVVVGVCLGAQLIARAAGARVYRNTSPEIGWFPVKLTAAGRTHPLTRHLPSAFEAFHWHNDTYDLPAGAVHLAESDACAQQMFALGRRVVGVQFHLEMTQAGFDALIENCAPDIIRGVQVQEPSEMRRLDDRLHESHAILYSILDRMNTPKVPEGGSE